MDNSADGRRRPLKLQLGGLVRFKSKPSTARVWLNSSLPPTPFLSKFSFNHTHQLYIANYRSRRFRKRCNLHVIAFTVLSG